MVDTRFKCSYDEFGTGMNCDYTAIQEFVKTSIEGAGLDYIPTQDVVIVMALYGMII